MSSSDIKIGIVTYSHPPVYPTTPEREEYVKSSYIGLSDFLSKNGFLISAPLFELRKNPGYTRFGIGDAADLDFCIDYLRSSGAKCLVVQLNQWTRISLITSLIKELDLPTALYANSEGIYPGEVTSSAAAASLLEVFFSKNCSLLERFRDSENEQFLKWLTGVTALQKMKSSRVICWGGFYGADIPFTRDDDAAIENIFVREVISEQEMVIMQKAEKIIKEQPARINGFIDWLNKNKVTILYDNSILTPDSLKFQIGQYFAVKDRLDELKDENIQGITVKCHFEVSTNCTGCTECLIPGFLPFGVDSEGLKPDIPVGCEGDLKGLLTSMMMRFINPKVPPLFGDIITYNKDYVLISNCGAASVYWAARSCKPEVTLPQVKLLPQVHGKSGSAVQYFTPEKPAEEKSLHDRSEGNDKSNNESNDYGGKVTYARLFRINRKYFMYLGTGKITQAGGTHGRVWPVTKVYFKSDPYLLFKTSPANHGSLTEGDITREIEFFCKYADIEVVRCDDNKSLNDFERRLSGI
jgi:L-fucose isomerase-like protein